MIKKAILFLFESWKVNSLIPYIKHVTEPKKLKIADSNIILDFRLS